MLLIMLFQNGLAAATFASPVDFGEQIQAGVGHDCAPMSETENSSDPIPMSAHDMLNIEHEECVESGCLDCVGSSPCTMSGSLSEAFRATASTMQWAAPYDPVPQSDLLYRPPII